MKHLYMVRLPENKPISVLVVAIFLLIHYRVLLLGLCCEPTTFLSPTYLVCKVCSSPSLFVLLPLPPPPPPPPTHLSPGTFFPTCGTSPVSSIARPFDDCPYSSLFLCLMLILQYFGYTFTKKISKSFSFFIKK